MQKMNRTRTLRKFILTFSIHTQLLRLILIVGSIEIFKYANLILAIELIFLIYLLHNYILWARAYYIETYS